MSTISSNCGSGNAKYKTFVARYDYSKDTGAVGDYFTAEYIPANAVIMRCTGVEETTMTSGGSATLAIAIGGTAVKAATAYNNAAFTGVDVHLSTPFQITSATQVKFTIGTAALTAGKYAVIVEYALA
jgi:hypothetical protein